MQKLQVIEGKIATQHTSDVCTPWGVLPKRPMNDVLAKPIALEKAPKINWRNTTGSYELTSTLSHPSLRLYPVRAYSDLTSYNADRILIHC